jgi:hypothetical protein
MAVTVSDSRLYGKGNFTGLGHPCSKTNLRDGLPGEKGKCFSERLFWRIFKHYSEVYKGKKCLVTMILWVCRKEEGYKE